MSTKNPHSALYHPRADECPHEGVGKACADCRAKWSATASTRYVVLAKRPSPYGPDGGFDYQTAGSIWPSREPVENHRDYCQASAEADRQRYGDVEYVIGRIEIEEEA